MIEPPSWIEKPVDSITKEGNKSDLYPHQKNTLDIGETVRIKCLVSKKSKPQYIWQKELEDNNAPQTGNRIGENRRVYL